MDEEEDPKRNYSIEVKRKPKKRNADKIFRRTKLKSSFNWLKNSKNFRHIHIEIKEHINVN
jgi:hypothetical protein